MISETQYAVGIDLGGTDIKVGLVRPSGEIEAAARRPTDPASGTDSIADRMADMVRELTGAKGLGLEALAGVGIGVPGVTTAEGVIVLAPNLDWRDVPFKEILGSRLDLRIEIDNDANVAALAEARVGVGAGCSSLFFMTLGTGIGGGMILDGSVHHGISHAAGEIGHMCVMPDGPECGCGRRGCLEAITAGPAMVRFVRDGLTGSRDSTLADCDPLTPESICNAASEGDALAHEAVARSARYLGIAAANINNVISPEVIAIGGGISAAGNLLLEPIIESARTQALPGMFEHTRIVLATLGNDAGTLGAAFLVL